MNNQEEINRLNFENNIWILFSCLCLINIAGDNNLKDYLRTNNINKKNISDNLFLFTLSVTLLIYIYFLNRNIKAYKKASEVNKELYKVKVFGSLFLIIGILLLIYFQKEQTSFNGSPAL